MATNEKPASFENHDQWYEASLASVSNNLAKTMYTYKNVFDGFSTGLAAHEAEHLSTLPGVISVIRETIYELHTTRTPFFLGIENPTKDFPKPNMVSEVIVGVLDTGVWPESPSFRDDKLGPVPRRWRGGCEEAIDFSKSSCNKKLIGARSFSKGYLSYLNQTRNPQSEQISPRDNDGHGTHTASTAAGSPVLGANLLGFASGTARGMASSARVATYKVCWEDGCFGSDILAGMDRAISDGVHMMSLSLGGRTQDYDEDEIAIGAFSAMERGILVSCSAGNSGPAPSILSNVAPWILTVGAGTLDRDFPTNVTLNDRRNYTGFSIYRRVSSLSGALVYAGNVSTDGSSVCTSGSLIPDKVKGKIVLCDRGVNPRVEKGVVVQEAGGLGMVLANTDIDGEELVVDAHLVPTTMVGAKAGGEIKSYMMSDRFNATTITMFRGITRVGVNPSPVVAAFSSRGPNTITPEILKPDLIAPGVNILAGWTGAVGPTGLAMDTRRVDFNIISGTSMSCPHVSGLAALLKAAHPEWSPAAIRSALMTTAYSTYQDGSPLLDASTGKPSTSYAHGSGHVAPMKALDPGLVYDLTKNDYLNFLCAMNYNSSRIKTLAGKTRFRCDVNKTYSVNDLNYPSFAAAIRPAKRETPKVFKRTVTNVGQNGATYQVSISSPSPSVKIYVTPQTLVFCRNNETKSFTLKVVAAPMPKGTNAFGNIKWSNGKYVVASPVAVSWV
ncbi:Subtilisin-like protease SBT1.7 [Striga hermonthica]|uniref:Subtilisin-like protease SBT1.7 n=1 Tax=Striga hermonthica TaxID=68872 RepID=A0A9N7RAV1_STRHE|nr:Subtilisin-like protease SBT1.7 [Striga hermonthica]